MSDLASMTVHYRAELPGDRIVGPLPTVEVVSFDNEPGPFLYLAAGGVIHDADALLTAVEAAVRTYKRMTGEQVDQ